MCFQNPGGPGMFFDEILKKFADFVTKAAFSLQLFQ